MTNAVNLASAAGTGFAFRNRIINGPMVVDQRAGGVVQTNVSSGAFIVDRFPFVTSQNSKWTVQQVSVTDLPGFTKSAYVTISTPYTTGAADYALVDHKIEGVNVADLAWGTASAKPVTLSFYVKSNVTGTYGVTILNGGATRGYCTTYNVTASATWQLVTITIPGDTTGTWATDNTTGIWLRFGLGAGSNYAFPTPNTWATSFGYQPSGGAVISGVTGGYWHITGVQLEVGSVATPFERRPYGLELALCQRYCQVLRGTNSFVKFGTGVVGGATVAWGISINSKAVMRATPTVSQSGCFVSDATGNYAVTSLNNLSQPDAICIDANIGTSSLNVGRAAIFGCVSGGTAILTADAEL